MPKLLTSRAADRLRRSKLRIPISKWRERGLAAADVMLASYPRSGNTWTMFMLAELLTGNELDFRSAETTVPIVGRHHVAPRLLPGGGRLIKTHEPCRSAYGRSIYLVRDVRDVALSLYKIRAVYGFGDGSLDEFLTSFTRGHIAGYGSWQAHVDSWLAAAYRNPDVLVIHYEDLIDDTVAKLGDMVGFLGVPADEARLREIVANNRPVNMRNRPTRYSEERMSLAVGRGTYGDWRTRYSEAQLSLLEPAMGAMRRAGYAVDTNEASMYEQ